MELAVAVVMVALVGDDSVTVKPSLGSNVVSPATLTVTVSLASLARKLTVPVGNAPPVKSVALAGLPPLPVTAQVADDAPVVSPERVTVNVNAVRPLLPSALFVFAASDAIANDGNGGAAS